MNIPLENQVIRNQIRKNDQKIYLKVGIGILLVALLELFVFLYYAEKQDASSIVVYVVIGLLIFVPLKELLPMLHDTSWEGQILEIESKDYVNGSMWQRYRWMDKGDDRMRIHMVHVYIHTKDDKTMLFDIVFDHPGQIQPYRVGDVVRRYKGTRYPLIINAEKERSICVMCGGTTFSEDGYCTFCGLPFIDNHTKAE